MAIKALVFASKERDLRLCLREESLSLSTQSAEQLITIYGIMRLSSRRFLGSLAEALILTFDVTTESNGKIKTST